MSQRDKNSKPSDTKKEPPINSKSNDAIESNVTETEPPTNSKSNDAIESNVTEKEQSTPTGKLHICSDR